MSDKSCKVLSLCFVFVVNFACTQVSCSVCPVIVVVVVYRLSIAGNNYCNAMEIVYTHTQAYNCSSLALRSTFFSLVSLNFWLNNNYCSRNNSNKLLPKAKGRNTHTDRRASAKSQTHTQTQACLAETETAATSSDQALLVCCW